MIQKVGKLRNHECVAHLLAGPVVAHHVLGERDVSGAAGLQRDGVRAEVLQHVVHVGEPQVLHAALPRLAQRHAQVLGATLRGGRGGESMSPHANKEVLTF